MEQLNPQHSDASDEFAEYHCDESHLFTATLVGYSE